MKRGATWIGIVMLGCGSAVAADYDPDWGVGVGIPYGALGVNFDMRVDGNMYASAGLGTGYAEIGYALGGRYYFADRRETARPRVSLMYGTYGSVEQRYTSHKGEDFRNVALGAGFLWSDGADGFDFDVYVVNVSEAKNREDNLTQQGISVRRRGSDPITVSIGYRRKF